MYPNRYNENIEHKLCLSTPALAGQASQALRCFLVELASSSWRANPMTMPRWRLIDVNRGKRSRFVVSSRRRALKVVFRVKEENLALTLRARCRVMAQFFLTQILMGSQGVYQALVSLD